VAVIAPGTINPDTAFGQAFRAGGQILVLNFSTTGSGADTWQAPSGINPVAVAWNGSDPLAVTMDANALVTFTESVLGITTGNLILICGGKS